MIETRIFISHSSKDKPFALKLANDLKAFAAHVWVDIWELRVGDSLKQRIKKALHENDFLSIILSPNSVVSEWVKFELSEALIKELDEEKVFVLPILFRDCRIPKSIKDKKYADFRRKYDKGLLDLLKALTNDKNRLTQIYEGLLGIHTKIPEVFLSRLAEVNKKVCLNAVFYPLFTFTDATHKIKESIIKRKCKYEILFQDPSCKYIDEVTKIVRKEYSPDQLKKEIETHIDNFKSLQKDYPQHIELRKTDFFPTFPMVIMDTRVFVGFYTYVSPAPSGLWAELTTVGTASKRFVDHYKKMWSSGEKI